MAYEDGPYIQMACICEQVIEDKTGCISVIRVIDTVTHTVAQPDAPEVMPPFMHNSKLVLMFKAGMARGRSTLKIVPELPSGETGDPVILTTYFEGDERGQNIFINLNYTFTLEGLYWFRILLDDVKITAIPFRVKYNRIVTGSTSQQ